MEVVVEFDYSAEENDELTIKKGDIIREVSQFEEGWYIGNLDGKVGVFPDNFVRILKGSDTPKEHKAGSKETVTAKGEEPEELAIKTQRVQGIGLGNIFSGQPIQLKQPALKDVIKDAESMQDKNSTSTKPNVPSSPPLEDRVRVRFDYEPKQPDELELQVDDVIQVMDRNLPDEGWWKGRNLRTRKVGVFPDNFVVPMNDNSKENDVQVSPMNNATNPSIQKPTSVTLHNGPFHNPSSAIRVTAISSPSVTTGSTRPFVSSNVEPPKLATKPIPSSVLPNNTATNKLGTTVNQRDSKVPISQTGRTENKVNDTAVLENQQNGDKVSGRMTKWKGTSDRPDKSERPISIVDERRSGDNNEATQLNGDRLTGLTSDRPRQTGRRLPSKFCPPTTPTSEVTTNAHTEAENHTSGANTPRSHHSSTNRNPSVPQEDNKSGVDITERRAADLSARAQRTTQQSQARSGPLSHSESLGGSTDLVKSPESSNLRSVGYEATKQALSKLQTQYDVLKAQHTQHLAECMQMSRETRQQIEQLKEANKQLRYDMTHGQRALTERIQSLMNEVDEAKKQRAADSIELTRLRNLLMQLDAKSLVTNDRKFPRQRQPAGDRSDDRMSDTEENDADSIYEEEDGPSRYKPMIGDNRGSGFLQKNGDINSTIAHSTSANKHSIAPPLRPRPTHPASYSRG